MGELGSIFLLFGAMMHLNIVPLKGICGKKINKHLVLFILFSYLSIMSSLYGRALNASKKYGYKEGGGGGGACDGNSLLHCNKCLAFKEY